MFLSCEDFHKLFLWLRSMRSNYCMCGNIICSFMRIISVHNLLFNAFYVVTSTCLDFDHMVWSFKLVAILDILVFCGLASFTLVFSFDGLIIFLFMSLHVFCHHFELIFHFIWWFSMCTHIDHVDILHTCMHIDFFKIFLSMLHYVLV